MSTESYQTERTTVRRLAQRGVYDRATIHQILDEGLVCHVGIVVDGQPTVIPMVYVRVGERVCLVLARSAFHHSVNYRSAVVFGAGTAIEEAGEKMEILQALSEHLIPGRWADVRGPSEVELKQTAVVGVAIREGSAKIRTGPPKDDEEDYALPVWAGVLPLRMTSGAPIADSRLAAGIPTPAYTVCRDG